MDTTSSATQPRRSVPRSFRTPVRGHAFASRPGTARDPHPGMPALLVREPGNPADPLAVAVWVEDGTVPWRIGYLDRGVSARVAPRLDRGQRFDARLDGWSAEPEGRWRRPVLLLRVAPDPEPQPGATQPAQPEPGATEPAPAASGPSAPAPAASGPAARGRSTPGTSEHRDAQTRGRPASSNRDPALPPMWGRPPGVVRRRLPRRA